MITEWFGHLDRGIYSGDLEAPRDRIADAARIGDWPTVTREAAATLNGINSWRIGGTSWFTPLHQAAYLGASTEVVRQLIAAGAWRTLRTADGLTAADIARHRGHTHLEDLLTLDARTQAKVAHAREFDEPLADAMRGFFVTYGFTHRFRFPTVTVLAEQPESRTRADLYCSVSGMMGGFRVTQSPDGVLLYEESRSDYGTPTYLVTLDDVTQISEY